ncbi:phage tail sheath family protein [Bradyrhizobium sp. HKCCYLS20291]|uniref:phage tail sheath family protein n=1 Tax=Bradyrhizobium sp. HKCCYLS20291 TaxID=3420766 RepID=UPI003EBAB72F
MATYRAPGVYVEEISSGSRPIPSSATSTAAFIGAARKGPVNRATLITGFAEFEQTFGGPYRILKGTQEHYLYYAVRHFFEQGGSRCYIVRVAHYLDPGSAATLQASPASVQFAGAASDGTAISPALTVSANSPGEWGQDLEALVVNTSAASLRLAGDMTAGNQDRLALVLNDSVAVGALLWIVEEVSGRIAQVNAATKAVSFTADSPLLAGSAKFAGPIPSKVPVYGPRLNYFGATVLAQPVQVAAGVADGIILSSLTKPDGSLLRSGDQLTFAITQAYAVVTRVSVQPGSPAVTLAQFTTQAMPAFAAARSRVYLRGFSLIIRRKSEPRKDKAVLEVHENLSLVNTDRTNHVNVRLGAGSGGSRYVVANDETGTNDLATLNNADATALTGGSDGLNNTVTNTNNLPDSDFIGQEPSKTGLYALTAVTDASILAIPNASETVTKEAIAFCERRGNLFLVAEKPRSFPDGIAAYRAKFGTSYAALYEPWITITDQVTNRPALVPPSGAVAGIYALTDSRRGVHKAPAGMDTGRVAVATGLERNITRGEYDTLYPHGVNAILKSRDGIFVWGSRTLSSDSQWLQINVRRLFIMLEQSILDGTQWATFEPNDLTLWKSIERNVSAFLRIQWLEGKLVGQTEKQAFFVNCNAATNPPEVVNSGQVVTVIGVAPSRPAEFVIFRIRQSVGQSAR